MRIDFFHVDLLNKSLKVKKVVNVDTDFDTSTRFDTSSEANRTQKNNIKPSKDYLDIQNKLYSSNFQNGDENEYISDDDLFNLKDSIKNNQYKINTKALSLSLIKHMERM